MELPKSINVKGFLALRLLHELNKKRMCGDELAQVIGQRTGNKLTPGTIYPALKFLRRKKLATSRRLGRKKLYTLTEEGKKEYRLLKAAFKKIFRDLF